MKKKVGPKLWQEVQLKNDIVTSDDIKIYNTGKFQDFSASYVMKNQILRSHYHTIPHFDALKIYSSGKHCKKRRNCM